MNKKTAILEYGLAVVIFAIFLRLTYQLNSDITNFAYGQQTQPYFAKVDESFIHIEELKDNSIKNLKQGWSNRGEKEVVFILGNSQTSAINQQSSFDSNYIQLISDNYNGNYDIICHSMPNANLQEMLYSFMFFHEEFPIKQIIIPVFVDDLREDNIREYFFKYPINKNFKIKYENNIISIINDEIEKLSLEVNMTLEKNEDMKALNETTQEKVEKFLDKKLSGFSEYWSSRKNMRGKVMIFLYQLRNTLLGINPQSKRKLIPKRTEKNLEALNTLLEFTELNQIDVLLYIPPIRNDVEIPYILEEYESIKTKLNVMESSFKNVSYINLESKVDGKYWGTKESTSLFGGEELDFMHFQFEGHKILYENLLPFIKN